MNVFVAGHEGLIFILMVAVAVFFLIYSLSVPAFGPERQAAKRLRKRLTDVVDEFEAPRVASLLREQYLRNLSGPERLVETLPGFQRLAAMLRQAGSTMPAYQLLMLCILAAAGAFIFGELILPLPGASFLLTIVAFWAPILYFHLRRVQRLNKFDEQLPEALDVIVRALRAGHPFNESLRLVGEEMSDPIRTEFGSTFADINYGADMRSAFLGLLERAPSMSLMTTVVSVLVQRETGGNLTEVLERNAAIVRARFRFQRKVRTLSAEGRMSAWVLALMPFLLVLMLMVVSPKYLPILIYHPTGQMLIMIAMVMLMIGTLWMRKIIRIEV